VLFALKGPQIMPTRLWSGQRLREVRERAGFSRHRLAVASDYPADRIWKYETGRSVPTLDSIDRLATALGIEPAELLVPTADRSAQS
jgi:transcriptional regulator with XRE-family HTH domain